MTGARPAQGAATTTDVDLRLSADRTFDYGSIAIGWNTSITLEPFETGPLIDCSLLADAPRYVPTFRV